jgi:SAM-dependent methyltransferase
MRRACARVTVLDFTEFTLSQLPPEPQRVLEVGCGREGGVAPALARAGHDVLAIDPDAPAGPQYRQITLEELDDPGSFDAVVAGRVLHHMQPLGPALDKLAGLAPLLVLDEFAWNHMDPPTVDWYESQHRLLVAAGREPNGPPDLAEWDARHSDLHPYEALRAELEARYQTALFEWRPYLYRWLGGPASEALETALIDAGAIRPIGFRYVGRTFATCSARDSR